MSRLYKYSGLLQVKRETSFRISIIDRLFEMLSSNNLSGFYNSVLNALYYLLLKRCRIEILKQAPLFAARPVKLSSL